nr:6-phosphogluconolactonase [Anaerolineae bacterium]
MPNTRRFPDSGSVFAATAEMWQQIAQQAIAERGQFLVALSDGAAFARLYDMLSEPPYSGSLPWEQTYVFWCDEKRVAPDDPNSNYYIAHSLLLSKVPVPGANIFPMSGQDLASSAARAYDTALWKFFGLARGEWPRFDLVLLSLGGDGHIASIFPGTRATSDLSNKVIVYRAPGLDAERITLTMPVLNNARHIILVATGTDKAEIVNRVITGPYSPSTYPAQMLAPHDGALTWLLDEEAASGLP